MLNLVKKRKSVLPKSLLLYTYTLKLLYKKLEYYLGVHKYEK